MKLQPNPLSNKKGHSQSSENGPNMKEPIGFHPEEAGGATTKQIVAQSSFFSLFSMASFLLTETGTSLKEE